MNITDIMEVKVNPNIPQLAPGDTVRVRQKVVEGEKTRIQVFQGVVIKIHNVAAASSFTVRRVTSGVGVERTFPVFSPMIDGVEVVRHGKVRRAKLYYLRGLSARASRIKEKRFEKLGEEIIPVSAAEQEQVVIESAQAAAVEQGLAAPVDETATVEAPKVETLVVEAPKTATPKPEA